MKSKERSHTYRKHWESLIACYGTRCFYCRKEIATTIDHVRPYSWDQCNLIDNLVPACVLCNSLASNMMFDDVEHKRQYILSQRAKRNNRQAICSVCLLPYTYLHHSPSILLCAECYDEEYQESYSQKKGWKKWILQLRSAGIPAAAHRNLKKKIAKRNKVSHALKIKYLIEEYTNIVYSDDEFASMLLNVI